MGIIVEQIEIYEPRNPRKTHYFQWKNWARLIQKIYHVDPLLCPKCQGIMKIISFIEAPDIIRKILVHLDLWDVRNHDPLARKHPKIQELTYDDSYSQEPFYEDCAQ